jgi:D-glycerate 3-kinase
MAETQDDKAQQVIQFILEHLSEHRKQHKSYSNPAPFFVGLNGVQGSSKSVLVSILQQTLENPPYSLPTVVLSLYDFYLTHRHQLELVASHQQAHSSNTTGSLQHMTSLSPLTS